MQLGLRPGRHPTSEGPRPEGWTALGGGPSGPLGPSGSGHPREVFENEGGVFGGQSVDERAREVVESRADPMVLSPSFATEQLSREPSVVGLLAPQIASASEVPSLDLPQFREPHSNEGSALLPHPHSVQGGLVGVEGDERGRCIRLRNGLRIDQDDPTQPDVNLGHAVVRIREDPSVVVGDGNNEGSPLPASQGEAEFTGLRVEVETVGGRADERDSHVGNSASHPLAEPTSVSAREGESDIGGGEADPSGHACLPRSVSSESGEGAPGGCGVSERLAQALVHEKTEVVHEAAKGQGDPGRRRVLAVKLERRGGVTRREGRSGGQWKHQGPARIHGKRVTEVP